MRHDEMNGDELPLATETMDNRPSRRDITPEAVDSLILKARQARADATAELLARLGAAMVRPFRGRTMPKLGGTASVVKGEPQRAV